MRRGHGAAGHDRLGAFGQGANLADQRPKNPSTIKGGTALEFMRKATPEQRERFDRARGQ